MPWLPPRRPARPKALPHPSAVLRPCRGDGCLGRSRAWAAQSGAGRAKRVHPECQPGCDSTDVSQGSWQSPCHQQILEPVPVPLEQQDQAQSLPTGALCRALQCRSATAPGVLTGLRHPWQCSGAKVGPLNLGT